MRLLRDAYPDLNDYLSARLDRFQGEVTDAVRTGAHNLTMGFRTERGKVYCSMQLSDEFATDPRAWPLIVRQIQADVEALPDPA